MVVGGAAHVVRVEGCEGVKDSSVGGIHDMELATSILSSAGEQPEQAPAGGASRPDAHRH